MRVTIKSLINDNRPKMATQYSFFIFRQKSIRRTNDWTITSVQKLCPRIPSYSAKTWGRYENEVIFTISAGFFTPTRRLQNDVSWLLEMIIRFWKKDMDSSWAPILCAGFVYGKLPWCSPLRDLHKKKTTSEKWYLKIWKWSIRFEAALLLTPKSQGP